jgi:O-antigen/teichoic acid export membrane protein
MVYALPLVAGNALYSLMPLSNRSLLASAHGFAEAGYFSLASDMGLRLFGTLGATLEIVLLREVIRLDEARGRRAALRQIARNIVVVLMVALPAAVGFFLVLPAFERLIVPPSFQGRFAGYMAVLIPGFVALTIFQAALYPVFLLGKRTGIATLAAALGLALNLAIVFGPALVVGQEVFVGPRLFAVAQSAGFVLALAVTAVAALRALPVWPPLRDCAGVVLAVALMALAIWPLSGRFPAAVELALQVGLGAAVYGGVLLAGNVMHGRSRLLLWRAARRSRSTSKGGTTR